MGSDLESDNKTEDEEDEQVEITSKPRKVAS